MEKFIVKKLREFLKSQTRKKKHQMVQLLTGHSKLKSFLHTIIVMNATVDFNEVESYEHFIFRCSEFVSN